MRLPSKIHSYDESTLNKFPLILEMVRVADTSVYVLFTKLKKHFIDVGEFIETLDCLFALGALELTQETRLLTYVDRNKM